MITLLDEAVLEATMSQLAEEQPDTLIKLDQTIRNQPVGPGGFKVTTVDLSVLASDKHMLHDAVSGLAEKSSRAFMALDACVNVTKTTQQHQSESQIVGSALEALVSTKN